MNKILNLNFNLLLFFIFFLFNPIHVHGASSPKNIIFILHTESVGGKGVYEIYKEMKKVGHNVKIVAIPSYYYKDLLTNIDIDFTKKFDEKDVVYPCGKNPPYAKCESIEQFQADYIFVQNPYESFAHSILDPHFLLSNMKKHGSKIMYIIYGPHLFHQDSINDPNLKNLVDVVFVDSATTKDIYVKKFHFPPDRVVVSGYQTYKTIRNNIEKEKPQEKETILWLPRWFLSYRNKDLFEGGSTFLTYYHFFYNYAKNNPNINFIIRPHLLLFSYPVKAGFLTQEELDEIFQKFRSLNNVTVSMHTDRPLVDDVIAADIVISDGTSALGEVVVADKPIIYLSNGWNNEFNTHKLANEFKKHIYLAYDTNDIIDSLKHIRNTNYHPFKENIKGLRNKLKNSLTYVKNILIPNNDREEFKKLLDPVENPAQFIAEYLLSE